MDTVTFSIFPDFQSIHNDKATLITELSSAPHMPYCLSDITPPPLEHWGPCLSGNWIQDLWCQEQNVCIISLDFLTVSGKSVLAKPFPDMLAFYAQNVCVFVLRWKTTNTMLASPISPVVCSDTSQPQDNQDTYCLGEKDQTCMFNHWSTLDAISGFPSMIPCWN